MINDWLTRVAYFVTPSVSGLPTTIIDHFINGGDLEQRIRDSNAKIISGHTDVLTAMFRRCTGEEKGLRTFTIDQEDETKIRERVEKYWGNKLQEKSEEKETPASASSPVDHV